uniref:N-acetylgalactosaminide beta-1,3-galactosyltransferase n=1 Tax=Rhabditophanes sp. KR3021 TaxID=114890 RepID=A0AC35UGF6_9BILA
MVAQKIEEEKPLTIAEYFVKAITPQTNWTHMDQILDVLYWFKQFLAVISGITCGYNGATGAHFIVFYFIFSVIVSFYFIRGFHKTIEGQENLDITSIGKEGISVHVALFILIWITSYTFFNFDSAGKPIANSHCAKTLAILKYFITNDHDARWLIVADDDSMMSLDRLYKMLNCMNWNENIILGERYGYGFRIESNLGYDYPTGGAGMTFSRSAAKLLVQECKCPANDSPDDMIIGMCARSVKIKIIHSDAFHQARPRDYSDEYLKRIKPISFHKFEDQDSVGVYFKYLENDVQHNEL